MAEVLEKSQLTHGEIEYEKIKQLYAIWIKVKEESLSQAKDKIDSKVIEAIQEDEFFAKSDGVELEELIYATSLLPIYQ